MISTWGQCDDGFKMLPFVLNETLVNFEVCILFVGVAFTCYQVYLTQMHKHISSSFTLG